MRPKGGDRMIWIILVVVAVAAVAGLMLMRGRRRA
jgi:hypothetical protein